MDLVPQMIRSMTRTSAYVSEEEQQELCQIGYLALCRRLPALIRTDLSCRMPEPLSATPSLTTGGKLPVTAPCCVLFRKLRWKGIPLLSGTVLLRRCTGITARKRIPLRHCCWNISPGLVPVSAPPSKRESLPFGCSSRAIPVLTLQGTIKYQPIVYGHGRAKHGNYYSRMMHSMHF